VSGGARVLVVDDDPAIVRMVTRSLGARGYAVEGAASGAEMKTAMARTRPDVVLLDLALPDADGIELCASIREHSAVPVIILSALSEEARKVRALDEGADDYLTKPFGIEELMARIRVVLRRNAENAVGATLVSGSLALDLETRELRVGGHPLRVTPREFGVLRLLLAHPGRVLTHRHLLSEVWGMEYIDDNHVLRTLVHQLRHKLNAVDAGAGEQIVTEPGVGYRFVSE
jgi:two-component system KDP operon response regulator KdpE